eukprot:TRINITY_DN65244_c0_g1_i1.p1 TRINITY_DN65244_c0_g1~~TRINITY_DN65244_c0_g1_i1.p1  ORF type:complete len:117 (-),score=22.48 TRINITY_DN65244_c0_g1_i1:99-449(-)
MPTSEDCIKQLSAGFASLSDGDRQKALKVKAVFQFSLPNAGDFYVDLKEGKIEKGKHAKADITINTKDEEFVSLCEGKTTGQKAFMAGKLKVKGNMMLAMKLDPVLKQLLSNKAKL